MGEGWDGGETLADGSTMQIKSSQSFDAPIDRVWELLIDPDSVARCVPGCEKLEPLGDDRYWATISVRVASIGGTYQGTVAIVEKRPPNSYKLLMEGDGRSGFVKGEGAFSLTSQGEATLVELSGEVQIGGTIARFGQRLLGGVSKMMVDRFFDCLKERVSESRSPE